MKYKSLLSSLPGRISSWLVEQLRSSAHQDARARRARSIIICAIVFLAAFAVRQLHWQDYHLKVGSDLSSLAHRYQKHARDMLGGEGILFPRDYPQPNNIQRLVHPPGYSVFVAAVFTVFGDSNDSIALAQIILDAAAAALVFLIAAELLPQGVAIIAALLVAFSPHLAQHTLMLLPDSLVAVPTLLAIYFLIKASKRPRLVIIIASGVMVGLSCWLRSNALLLALFLGIAAWLLFDRERRARYSIAVVCAAALVVAPITIRNWMVFRHFIPLSLGSGITMVEGIADYDKEKRFDMPASDAEGKWKDVEWHNRPDYAEGLWRPDGIERDKYRFSRGLEVISKNPAWFAGVMIRRAEFMLRYNDSRPAVWPENTARSPIVSAEPSFGQQSTLPVKGEPVWSGLPSELLDAGETLSPQAECSIAADGQTLEVKGDDSSFGDQFVSALIPTLRDTDYVLRLDAGLIQGRAAAKVVSADRRIALASAVIEQASKTAKQKTDEAASDEEDSETDSTTKESPGSDSDSENQQRAVRLLLPFASGNRSEVRLVISNNGTSTARPVVEVRQASLHEFGPTPYQWSRYARPLVRAIERNIYTTSHLTPLVLAGIALLAAARRFRELICLLAVPAYYLSVQSAFHTEYRYIIAIHYFLFAAAAVAIYVAGAGIAQIARRIFMGGR